VLPENQDSNASRARDFFLFRVFRLAVGLTTPPIQWMVGSLSFGGGKNHLGMKPSGAKFKSA
jgi:hypothetical protein